MNIDEDATQSEQQIPVYARRIKDMDKNDTPRERAEKHGCSTLSTPDLWAIILRTGLPGKPITELCRDLMNANDGRLSMLERRTRAELLSIKGLGPLKVTQIQAVMELVRRYNSEELPQNPQIRSSSDIFNVMHPYLANLPHEEIWAMMLNRANRVVKITQLSKGGISASVFDVKLLMKTALLENASGLVLAHNHPSGNLNPSKEDDNITKRCIDACASLDIKFIDHLILTPKSYFSYFDEGSI